jgi:hypothetical protein
VYHISAPTYTEYGDVYFTKRVLPVFRIVWNEENINDGIMLQMALTSNVYDKATVRVVDRTGADSYWVLVDTHNNERPTGTTLESQQSCVMPNGSTWNSTTGQHSDTVPVYSAGYTIMHGSIDIGDIEELSVQHSADVETGTIPNMVQNGYEVIQGTTENTLRITGSDIDFKYIAGVQFEVHDRLTGTYRYGETRDIVATPNGIKAAAMYFYDDLCVIEAELKEVDSGYVMVLKSHTGTNSLNTNRFSLTRVDLFSATTDIQTRRVVTVDTDTEINMDVDTPMSLTRANTIVNFGRL